MYAFLPPTHALQHVGSKVVIFEVFQTPLHRLLQVVGFATTGPLRQQFQTPLDLGRQVKRSSRGSAITKVHIHHIVPSNRPAQTAIAPQPSLAERDRPPT